MSYPGHWATPVPLRPLSVTDSQTTLLLRTVTVLRHTGHMFCRISLGLGLSDIFLTVALLVYGFLGRRLQRSSTIGIPSGQGHPRSAWLSSADVDLDHVAEVILIHFPHCEPSVLPPHSGPLRRKPIGEGCGGPFPLSEGRTATGLIGDYFAWRFVYFLWLGYVFHHIFTSVCTQESLFYSLG